jgi:hypothetical protein
MIYRYWEFASELVPGYLLDIAAVAQGKQAFSADIYRRIGRTLSDYEYFLNREWKWKIDNAKRVQSSMSEADRKTFNLCMKSLHWDTYIENVSRQCPCFGDWRRCCPGQDRAGFAPRPGSLIFMHPSPGGPCRWFWESSSSNWMRVSIAKLSQTPEITCVT